MPVDAVTASRTDLEWRLGRLVGLFGYKLVPLGGAAAPPLASDPVFGDLLRSAAGGPIQILPDTCEVFPANAVTVAVPDRAASVGITVLLKPPAK